jgi:single-strand DNA-binding protein
MRLACNGRRRNAEGGYEPKPNYFDVSVFGPQGENVHRYLQKGRPVAVDGRLDWREWDTAEGQRRQAVTIVATDVQFLGGADNALAGTSADEVEPGEEELFAAKAGVEAELVA